MQGGLRGLSPASLGIGVEGGGDFGAAERQHCFHVMGFDVLPAEDGRPYILEVNCHPSLGVDSVRPPAPPPPAGRAAWLSGGVARRAQVFPQAGPHAETPVDPPASAAWAPLWRQALSNMPKFDQRTQDTKARRRRRAPCAALTDACQCRRRSASAARTRGRTCTGPARSTWPPSTRPWTARSPSCWSPPPPLPCSLLFPSVCETHYLYIQIYK